MRTRAALLSFCINCVLIAADPSAAELYEMGRKAEKAGHMAEAYLRYSQAVGLEPQNTTYWLRSQAVRSRAALEAKVTPHVSADDLAAATPPQSPADVLDPPTAQERRDARRPLPPTALAADSGTRDFNLREPPRSLFEHVAHAFGLDCIFDDEYRPTAVTHFEMTGVDYREALHGLELATGSFIVPLSSKLFMVATDTPQKRNQLEPYIVVTVRLPEATNTQDFVALIAAVQQTFAIERAAFDSQNNTVFFRGPISKVLPAREMFEDLLQPRAQVYMEVKVLEVSLNDLLTWGIQVPRTFPLVTFPQTLANLTLSTSTVFLAFQAVNATLVAQMSSSKANTLIESDLRSIDMQPATLHVGERFPILTAGYYGPQSFQTGGQVYTPPPSFNYEDLGLSLKVTPDVHNIEELTLDIEAEYKVLTGQEINGIPVIANRSLKTRGRLKFGEWAMMSGLLSTDDTRDFSGVAGISQIPLIGRIPGTHDRNRSKRQVLLLVRPRLLSPPPSEMVTHTFAVGSDTRPANPY